MIQSVDHINIVVDDLERSVRFYTQVLGLKETRRAHLEGDWIEAIVGLKGVVADVVFVVAPNGEPRIELLQYRSPLGEAMPATSLRNTIGLRHIAFRVSDIQKSVAILEENGVPILSKPVAVPGNVIAHSAGDKQLCYFHDPDGVLLELAQYT